MGHRNVTTARWVARKLRSVNAVLALLHMAYRSMDDDDPPTYWGGWEELAIAIGFDVPPEPEHEDQSPEAQQARGRRKTAKNGAVTATKVLEKAGIIRVAKPKAPGRNTTHSLHISSANSPETLGTEQSREVRANSPEKSGRTVPRVSGLEEEVGDQQENRNRNQLRSLPKPQDARDNPAETERRRQMDALESLMRDNPEQAAGGEAS